MSTSDKKDTKKIEEEILLAWKAPEFIEYQRSWKWYAGAGTLFVIVLAYGILAKDWFIIPIAAILLAVTLYYQKEKPMEANYRISPLGFFINDVLIPYNQLHSFWLVTNDDLRILNIIFINKFMPPRSILFYGVDPEKLRESLSKYLPEQEERTENIVEKLARLLKI